MDEAKDVGIVFGEVSYENDAGRLMDTEMRKVSDILEQKAMSSKSVREVLELDIANMWPVKDIYFSKVLLEEKIGKFVDGKWQGETSEQLTKRTIDFIRKDVPLGKELDKKTKVIDFVSKEMIDLDDLESVQMVMIKDESQKINDADAYMLLVVYPPENGSRKSVRKREVSYLTADCHTVAAVALLDQSWVAKVLDRGTGRSDDLENIELGDDKYVARSLKLKPVTDTELLEVVSNRGRTAIDRFIQVGLKVIDKHLNRDGEHIDPMAAMKDQVYAMHYTLACHRGVGNVINRRIKLPAMESRT